MRSFVVWLLLSCACLPQVGPPLDADGGTGGGGAMAMGGGAGGGGGTTATCTDLQHNGTETDVDCGGLCGPCVNGKACSSPRDCTSGRCRTQQCVAPASVCPSNFSGCNTFTDLTSDPAPTIRFPVGGDRYSPDCIRVRLGQTVTLQGDFGPHTLAQSCGPVNDLFSASTGLSHQVTFDQGLGLYGFYCTQHGSPSGSGMAGAVEVVP